mmetsp:Transcript_7580/g.11351  ORF Transcript_7580/g.11351 Transcript_7580/m.11351 type:complete len:101 (-) Transcript_7580:78-380(-)
MHLTAGSSMFKLTVGIASPLLRAPFLRCSSTKIKSWDQSLKLKLKQQAANKDRNIYPLTDWEKLTKKPAEEMDCDLKLHTFIAKATAERNQAEISFQNKP